MENTGTKLTDLGLGKDFMNLTPKAREVKTKIHEWDCMFLHSKTNSQQQKSNQLTRTRYLQTAALRKG